MVTVSAAALRLLVVVAALDAAAAARCDPPFKTLSSDCRDLAADGKTLCLVVDRSAGQPSLCSTTAASKRRKCYSGPSCDLVAYKVDYQKTQARFEVSFPGQTTSVSAPAPAPPRVLAAQVTSAPPPTTAPPTILPQPQPTLVNYPPPTPGPSAGSGSGGLVVPPPTVTPTPTPPPSGPVPGPVTDWNSDNDPASERNEFVQAIGALRLSSALTDVFIVGGSSEYGARGATAQVAIDASVLTQSKAVTSVTIANCAIGDQLVKDKLLTKGLPPGLTSLNLRNTQLRDEPSDLSVLTNLKKLTLGQNYLSALSSKVSLPALTFLDLSENTLASFDANAPALESLNLNSNNLNAIPDAVYAMTKLNELSLKNNRIVSIVVSETQFTFLAQLHLQLDHLSGTPPSPTIYVKAGTRDGLVLDSKDVDLTTAVAIEVGTLADLDSFPVWKLSDADYKVFRAQQVVLAKASLVIGGSKAEPYQATAAAVVSVVPSATTTPNPSGSDSSSHGPAQSGSGSKSRPDVSAPGGSNPNVSKNGTTSSPGSAPLDAQRHAAASNKSKTVLTVSLVTIAAVGVLCVVFFIARSRRRSAAKGSDSSIGTVTSPFGGSSLATGPFAPKTAHDSNGSFGALAAAMDDSEVRDLFSSRRIRLADLHDVRPIGTGTTGIVWLVKLRGSRLLASKRLVESTSTRMAQFVNEIVIAAGIDHPSIISLVGVAWTSENDLQALYEYMPNGDLQSYLANVSPDTLAWSPAKITMAIEIVEALVYTHSFNPPLLHRDLRASNVLLDYEMNPKLSNFGSARFASEQNTMTTDGIGSGRWLAPEILKGSTDYNASSDMYAFGVLLSELDTHATPYEDVRDSNSNTVGETQILELVTRGALRPTLSTTCPSEIRDLATRCWSQDPDARPAAMQVAYEMRLLVGTAT